MIAELPFDTVCRVCKISLTVPVNLTGMVDCLAIGQGAGPGPEGWSQSASELQCTFELATVCCVSEAAQLTQHTSEL